MTRDQRKTARFKPRNRVFASLGSNLTQVGKIVDISLDGLSFEFISNERALETVTHVDIFTLDEAHCLTALPCSVVYQLSASLPGVGENGDDSYKTRRCGLKYEELQGSQWRQLADFLENHAVEPQPQHSDISG